MHDLCLLQGRRTPVYTLHLLQGVRQPLLKAALMAERHAPLAGLRPSQDVKKSTVKRSTGEKKERKRGRETHTQRQAERQKERKRERETDGGIKEVDK